MARERKRPEDKLPVGRRPLEFRQEFCELIVEHMRAGKSFRSFGAVAGCGKTTLYKWAEEHTEFADAISRGQPLLEEFYVKMGQMLATGQLRRVSKEEPVMHKGKPVMDPVTGQVLMRREYEHVPGNATAWIFLCKNMVGFRDRREIGIDSNDPPPSTPEREMSPEERLREIREMTNFLKEVSGADDRGVIDVTPTGPAKPAVG